jgi:hypothetical protein
MEETSTEHGYILYGIARSCSIILILTPEKRAFSDASSCAMLSGMFSPDRKVVFSAQAVLALPHLVTDCEAALLKGNRDGDGHPQVLCSFSPGEVVRPLPPGLPGPSAIVLAPADARALARELERAAEEAEEQ